MAEGGVGTWIPLNLTFGATASFLLSAVVRTDDFAPEEKNLSGADSPALTLTLRMVKHNSV